MALVATARHARADDPRDLFGLGSKSPAQKASCDDGELLGCAFAADRFDEVSPYALRTWLPATYLLQLPVADSRADAVAHFATGASRDEAGPAFAGATGLENRWTIEGAPVESLRNGAVETRVPLTFMDTMLVTAGGFAARDRASTGGTIEIRLRRGTPTHEIEAHAWASDHGSVTRRPIPESSFTLRRLVIDAGPDASLSVVATGPLPSLLGGKTWYAAGIAPALAYTDFNWTAARLVDRDNDALPDGFPGVIDLETIENTHERTLDYLVPMMARAGWERGEHAVDLTLIGQASGDTFFLANATKQAGGVDRDGYAGDAIATWRGTWKRTHARAQFAWHRSVRRETEHEPTAPTVRDHRDGDADWRSTAQRQLLSAYVPTTLFEDPALASACDDLDPNDPYPMIPNCPIPFGFFASGGAGLLTDATGDRPTMTADVTHAYGRHTLRAGATLEDQRLVLESIFTGGELLRSLFDGHIDRQRFYSGECTSFTASEPEQPCNYTTSQTLRYRTRYTAAYLEDTFEPVPKLRVDGGVRWELMWVGTQLHLSREWAPRLGVAYDLGDVTDRTSRVFASMGRSFVLLPAGLGPTVIRRNNTVRDVFTEAIRFRNVNSGNAFTVAPGIEPAAQDEATIGLELGVPKLLRLQGWVQGRSLRRGYETVVYDADHAAFDNPGRHGEEPATRETVVVAAEAMLAPSPKMTLRATYSYGQTIGSWTGPFDPRQGTNLYNGDDWDGPTGNISGPLPTDYGHRFAFELERRGKVRSVELAVAGRLTTQSGRPRNILADSDAGVIYLLRRGSAGRGELVSQANVRVAARYHHTDITLDVFNLFDHHTVTNLDELYTSGDIQPIHGTEQDLVWAKTSDGTPAPRRTAFRLPVAYQSPIAVSLGVHQTF